MATRLTAIFCQKKIWWSPVTQSSIRVFGNFISFSYLKKLFDPSTASSPSLSLILSLSLPLYLSLSPLLYIFTSLIICLSVSLTLLNVSFLIFLNFLTLDKACLSINLSRPAYLSTPQAMFQCYFYANSMSYLSSFSSLCVSLSLAILLLLSVFYLSRSVFVQHFLLFCFIFLSYYYLSFWLNLFFPPFPSLIAHLFFSLSLSPSLYSPSLVLSFRKRRCRQKIEETRSFGYFWTFRGSHRQLKRRKQKRSKTEEKLHLKIDKEGKEIVKHFVTDSKKRVRTLIKNGRETLPIWEFYDWATQLKIVLVYIIAIMQFSSVLL